LSKSERLHSVDETLVNKEDWRIAVREWETRRIMKDGEMGHEKIRKKLPNLLKSPTLSIPHAPCPINN